MGRLNNEKYLNMQTLKSDISHDAVSFLLCDLSHRMDKIGFAYYDALMRLMPPDETEASWARTAKVSSSIFQDMKRKGTRPRVDTLQKLLDAARVTMSDFQGLLGRESEAIPETNVVTAADSLYRHRSNPMDVPVWGSAEGADYTTNLDEPGMCVETTALMPNEIIDRIRRPIGIAEKRNVYALFVVGTSMEPRYLDGEPIFCDPGRAPAIGDHVVLQLVAPDGNGGDHVVRAMVKKLERRTADYYYLSQYTPAITFKIAKANVSAIHRVIPPNELYGI